MTRYFFAAALSFAGLQPLYAELPPGVPTHLPDFGPDGKVVPVPVPDKKAPPVQPRKKGRALKQLTTPPLLFPCQDEIEKKKDSLPKIVLAGETHDTKEAQTARKKRLDDAAGGKCHVAVEGMYCENKGQLEYFLGANGLGDKTPVAGFDEPMIHGLSVLLKQFVGLSVEKDPDEIAKLKAGLALNFGDNEFLKAAWESLKAHRPFPNDPSEEAIAKVLDATRTDSLGQAQERLKNLAADHVWHSDTSAHLTLLKKLTRIYVANAKSDKNAKKYHVPTNLSELVEDTLTMRNPKSALDGVVVEWRNQFLAVNLATLYCKALAAGKDLHVMVGSLHVPGLKTMIQTASKGLVPVEEQDVMSEFAELLENFPLPKPPPGNAGGFGGTPHGKTGEVEIVDPSTPVAPQMGFGAPVDQAVRHQAAQNSLLFVKDGVRYELHLQDVKLFGDEVLHARGSVLITATTGSLKDSPDYEGRKKYFLQEVEKAAKADKKIAELIAAPGIPKSENSKATPVSGPVKSVSRIR